MRTWRIVAVAVAVVAVAPSARAAEPVVAKPTTYPGGTWQPPGATYGVVSEGRTFRMSDGADLWANVSYPAIDGARAPGRFPVLLSQTPYSGSIGAAGTVSGAGPGDYFVERGYIYVLADVRGTGRSGGSGGFFSERDAEDGRELVDQVAALDGSNGVVGLHGCSYLGHTQLYTAARLGPGSPVRAMVPACSGSDPYRTNYMENGIHAPAWEGAGLLGGTLLGPTIEAYMVPKYLESQAGGDTAYYGTFWRQRDHVDQADEIARTGIATLLWNGWNDSGFGGLELFTALQNASFGRKQFAPLRPGQRVTGRIQLILGDWSHGGGLDPGIELQWYETWLKGVDTGIETDTRTPLHVEDRVTHEWTNLASYPIAGRSTQYQLGTGSLGASSAAEPATDTLVWGPPQDGQGTVSYESAPLAAGATLAGPSAITVEVASTNTDLQLMADLFDVDTDGTETLVTHGGILGSLSRLDPQRSWTDDRGRPARPYLSLTEETPLVPGAFRSYVIPLQPTLWSIAPGNRLVLRLSTQADAARCFQKAAAITTSVVGCRARAVVQQRLAGGTYTIRLGGTHPSSLSLPLLPYGSLPATASGPTGTSAAPLPLDW